MRNFRVLVWCDACRGDDEGCFGGEAGVLRETFRTYDAAVEAARTYCTDLPYRFRVEETIETEMQT